MFIKIQNQVIKVSSIKRVVQKNDDLMVFFKDDCNITLRNVKQEDIDRVFMQLLEKEEK